MSQDLTLYGYARGHYSCRCMSCGQYFTGDKKAQRCLECAQRAAKALEPTLSPAVAEATIRSETRGIAMGLAHYTSAVVMAQDNTYRRRALLEAVNEIEAACARIRGAMDDKPTPRGPIPVLTIGEVLG